MTVFTWILERMYDDIKFSHDKSQDVKQLFDKFNYKILNLFLAQKTEVEESPIYEDIIS